MRELVKRIRKVSLPDASASFAGLSEQVFDGSTSSADQVIEAAQSPSLMGGLTLVLVREAHALKNVEGIASLVGPKSKVGERDFVCVFLSKDLDGRKKISKQLLESAAVVPCEAVLEADRPAWVDYLAKRRELKLSDEAVAQLSLLDEWSLDLVDQELEKVAVSMLGGSDVTRHPDAIIQSAGMGERMGERFVDAYLLRQSAVCMGLVKELAAQPEVALPMMGLLGWNVRQLAQAKAAKSEGSGPSTGKASYIAAKLDRWSRLWSLKELELLQAELTEIDFSLKQTPLSPLGLWAGLIHRLL